MSYILDALKKSEEERHQGQVPNLGSNSTLIHTPKPRSSVWIWVIAVLLVINIIFVGYWVLSEKLASSAPKEEQLTVSELALEPEITPGSALVPEPEKTHQMVEAEVEVEKLGVSEQRANAHNQVAIDYAQSVEAEAASLSGESYQTPVSEPYQPPIKDVIEEKETAIVTVQESPMIITPKGKSRPYTGPVYTQTVDEGDKHNAVSANQGIPQQEESNRGDITSKTDWSSVPRVSDKPHSFQIKIPDLTFNSHIYTDIPSARRVMINNIYLREGQTFSGMKVEQIIEGGIILSIEGESFRMGVLRDWYSPR